ncbi:MAG: 16S rRNA processing protein RimM [Myxococcaceae bacterium]|nr:16S rRNA processing protein RimM [Myxococcaceae bacterium]
MSTTPHLQLGYIARAHGLSGDVVVRTFDPASETLFEVHRVWVKRRDGKGSELPIASVRVARKELLVTFGGVEGRTAAEALVGATVYVFREDLEPPKEGEYFQGDLIGLEAVTESGEVVGRVVELWNTGEVPTLVIRGGPEELLLPFADDFVGEVDLQNGRVVVRPIEAIE